MCLDRELPRSRIRTRESGRLNGDAENRHQEAKRRQHIFKAPQRGHVTKVLPTLVELHGGAGEHLESHFICRSRNFTVHVSLCWSHSRSLSSHVCVQLGAPPPAGRSQVLSGGSGRAAAASRLHCWFSVLHFHFTD